MSALTPFVYADQPVRVATVDGEPWFVLADLCRVLDLPNTSMVARRLTDDMKGVTPIDTPGGRQAMTIVSEAGMYEVVIRSDKPEAAAFRRWITTEVLPSIRKTGQYGTPALTGPALMAAALLEADQTMRALTATVDDQRARLRLVEPKAAAFDRWLSSSVDYSADQAAKALAAAGATKLPTGKATGRNGLLEWMGLSKELGGIEWIFRNSRGHWVPYQQQGPAGAKRLNVKLGKYEDQHTGLEHGTVTVRVTPKGVADMAVVLGVLPEAAADYLDGAGHAAA